MSLTGALMKMVTSKSARRFEQATRDPLGTQTAKLLSMMKKNADTDYGRRYGFAQVKSIADYQARVPVVTYEDIRADMDRVVAGDAGVFTAEDPVMFAQTSGTMGHPKFIPVTPTCRGHDQTDVMRTWLWHAARAHPTLFDRIVSLVSPAVEGKLPSGVPYGSTSGEIYRNQPWVVRRVYPIPYTVFEIDDYQAKYYVLMRLAIEHPVTFLTTANPSSILKLCQKGNEFAEQIIRDIRDGKLSDAFAIAPAIRTELAQKLRPNVGRARQLEELRDRRGGRLLPGDYWPSLAMIGCWKGGTVGHNLDSFAAWFDPDGDSPKAVRDLGYLSSEFRGSVPLTEEGSHGVLTVGTNFYEFVEREDLQAKPNERGAWRFLTCDQLEDGKEYYIFVSTSGGLYRYDINDIIRVEGTYNATPEIVFVRKGRGMTNITGEKVSVDQVIETVRRSASQAGVLATHFRAEADSDKSMYEFLVEFSHPPEKATALQFLRALDDNLKELNLEYKSKRDSQRLAPPELYVMREGWNERERQQRVAGGMRDFQAKTILLDEKRKPERGKLSDVSAEDVARVVQWPDPRA